MTPEEYAQKALLKCHDCDGWDADKLNRHVTKAIRQAIADEREACAKLIEYRARQREDNPKSNWVELDAAAIRNRK